jgi:hypothetical protein
MRRIKVWAILSRHVNQVTISHFVQRLAYL